jgi:hemerythrin superfamily protein
MDALTLLTQDHRKAESLFNDFIDTPHDQTRKDIVDLAGRELGAHAAAEEMAFYPKIKDRIEDGEHLIEESLKEHKRMKEVLAQIERLGPHDLDWERMILELVSDTKHHIADEEHRVFPKVRAAFSEKELAEMGEGLERAKAVAPTHSHPMGPSQGIAAKVADPVAGVLDKARDMAGRRKSAEEVEEEVREHRPDTILREPHTP